MTLKPKKLVVISGIAFFGYWVLRGVLGLLSPLSPILVTGLVGYPLVAYPHSLLIFGGLFFALTWRFGIRAIPLWFFAYTSWELLSGAVFLAFTGLLVPIYLNGFLMIFGLIYSRTSISPVFAGLFIGAEATLMSLSWTMYQSMTFEVEIVTEMIWVAFLLVAFRKRVSK